MDKVDTKVANLFAVIITGMMECLDSPVIMSHHCTHIHVQVTSVYMK